MTYYSVVCFVNPRKITLKDDNKKQLERKLERETRKEVGKGEEEPQGSCILQAIKTQEQFCGEANFEPNKH